MGVKSKLPASEKQERRLEEELEHLEEDVQHQGLLQKLRQVIKVALLGQRS